jgi:hypothetical protein
MSTSHFVPFALHKLATPVDLTPEDLRKRNLWMLGRVLNMRTTVAFTGAGLSVPYKMPTWKGLTVTCVNETLARLKTELDPNSSDGSPASELTGAKLRPFFRRLTEYQAKLATESTPGFPVTADDIRETAQRLAELSASGDMETIASGLASVTKMLAEQEESLKQAANRRSPLASDELLLILGECQKALEIVENKPSDECTLFHKGIADQVKTIKERPTEGADAVAALLRLPIRRFVTSNYDRVLETRLEEIRHVSFKKVTQIQPDGLQPPKHERSFTQDRKYTAELALFTLARVSSTDDMVFHCHGSIDQTWVRSIPRARAASWTT